MRAQHAQRNPGSQCYSTFLAPYGARVRFYGLDPGLNELLTVGRPYPGRNSPTQRDDGESAGAAAGPG